MNFLRKREDFVDLMIKHIGTSAIMDLLLRMLTCIEPQQLRQDVLNVGNGAPLFFSFTENNPVVFKLYMIIITSENAELSKYSKNQ